MNPNDVMPGEFGQPHVHLKVAEIGEKDGGNPVQFRSHCSCGWTSEITPEPYDAFSTHREGATA